MKRFIILLVCIFLALTIPLSIEAETPSSATEDSSAVTETFATEASSGLIVDANETIVEKAQDFADYFEKTIVPIIFIVASSAATLYLLVIPLLNKVRNASKRFKDATTVCEGVTATEEQRITEMKKQIAEIQTAFNEFIAGVSKAMEEIVETSNKNTEAVTEMVQDMAKRVKDATDTYQSIKEAQTIAFLNDENLVRKGYAKQIADVLKGEKHGREESEL